MKYTACLFFVYALFLGFNNEGCKGDQLQFDTEVYHKRTLSLRKNMKVLDSLSHVIGNSDCFEKSYMDSLIIQYEDFCATLGNYDLPDKTLLTVEDCVIKKEIITLKTRNRNKWLKSQVDTLSRNLKSLSTEVDSFKRYLEKTCVRKFNLCEQLKKHGGNKKLLKTINHLVEIRSKTADEISKDSIKVLEGFKKHQELLAIPGNSTFYKKMLTALVDDIKYQLGKNKNKYLCDAAHIRWASLEKAVLTQSNECEVQHIEALSSSAWKQTIDVLWFREQAALSRQCAVYPRGCMCENAENYDPLVTLDNETCIGCMDTMAMNYCPSAKMQQGFPCQYEACTDRCYLEELTMSNIHGIFPNFKKGRDVLLHQNSMCSNYICGCMNPCADNYDPNATLSAIPDICTGEICGCLDTTAVNYARRTSPDWAYRKYYDDRIVKHDSSLCIYKGCTSECALNYDPVALTNDNSCICDSTSRQELEKIKVKLGLEASDYAYSAVLLKQEFDAFLSKKAKKYSSINFKRIGMDLFVDLEMKEMRIDSRGDYDGVPLGQYNFKPVNELIDALISFLNFKTGDLLSSMLFVKIIGEADAHPVRGKGIEFKNAGRPISNEMFKMIDANTSTSTDSVYKESYNLVPDSDPVNLIEGDKIRDNVALGFLRAYIVKQKIKDAEPLIEESRILLGVKANAQKGKKYRRIVIVMQLSGFYEVMGQRELENLTSVSDIDAAIEYFETIGGGFPKKGKTYNYCPCISTAFNTLK